MTRISFPRTLPNPASFDSVLLIASHQAYENGWPDTVMPGLDGARMKVLVAEAKPGRLGSSLLSLGTQPTRLVLGVLANHPSRHASPTRLEGVWQVARTAGLRGKTLVVAAVDEPDHAQGVLLGLSRAFPLYDRKTSKGPSPSGIAFCATTNDGVRVPITDRMEQVLVGGQQAARLVDMPTAELDTAGFVREVRRLIKGAPHVRSTVLKGRELEEAGLGGIFAVGKAAATAPRLLIMDYKPPKARHTLALVGKGVVYDTGGLHLKARGMMETMKGDMGGGAAVAMALRTLAFSRCKNRIVALIPLAENAIDRDSYRPDDIITLHSGHTVEINNTDAEGRLLLGDAVSYAARRYRPHAIIDAATLTGAQLIATGTSHAAVMSNRDGLEHLAVSVGRDTGETCWPLLFCPELHAAEFESQVADMKNSVKDRSNAQTSCAGWFVYAQIDDLDIPWLHVDLAGPAWRHDRGTGFGVGLLSGICDSFSLDHIQA